MPEFKNSLLTETSYRFWSKWKTWWKLYITPVDIAINSDKIYVTDSSQSKILVFDLEGNFKKAYNDRVGGFSLYPEGIVFDEEGNLYVVDNRNNRIIHYSEFFVPLSIFGYMGNGDGEFHLPKDVAISSDGYLFVTDTQGNRVQKFSTPLVKHSPIIEEEKPEPLTTLESKPEQITNLLHCQLSQYQMILKNQQ